MDAGLSPRAFRERVRAGLHTGQTSGVCPGFAQTNLVVLPMAYAYDFLLYAQRNPAAIPLLEVTDAGERLLRVIAPGADTATDYPRYRVYRDGVLTGEPTDVTGLWRDDFVSFHIGCSFSFESALMEAGVPVRNIEENRNVPMFVTNIPCAPAGVFSGTMVVSMRPIPYALIPRAVSVTAQSPRVHGAPVHIGDPSLIGINDITRPDFGEPVTIRPGEQPVFWPCGVTPQVAVLNAKPDIAITHSPGHMLVTDTRNAELRV
ncbi:MAG: putative hydro-lyase [Oscillospiraceae bacterium]|nr:putative hydro-lyase [Oscillospiraceae bacterium]